MKKNAKLYFLPLILLVFILSNITTRAQAVFNGQESNAVRLDPKWTLPIGQLGDSFFVKDAITDSEGNTYWYGYFNRGLKIDTISLYPNKNGNQVSTQVFLFKIDQQGKLQWYLHSPNRSLACQLSFNPENKLIITGSNRDKHFNIVNDRGDTSHIKSNKNGGNFFFVAQIGEDGSVTDYKQTKSLGFNYSKAFKIDDDGNYLVSTSVDIKIDRGQSYSYSSTYGFFKLTPDLKEIWSIKGTKPGATAITKIVQTPEGNYVLGGVVSPTFKVEDKIISNGGSGVVPLLISLDKDGKLIWMKDSLADAYGGSIGDLSIASNGDIALSINPQSNPPTLYLVDSNAKLKWKNKLINKRGGMKINTLHWQNDELYVVGSGRGAAFESQSVNSYSLQSKGSNDVFVASYNSKGEIKALKAFGGTGNERSPLSVIQKNKLVVLSNFERDITFKKTSLKPAYGIRYLLSAFSLSDLKDMKNDEDIEETHVEVESETLSKSCYCPTEEMKTGFTPSLGGMFDYESFAKKSDWKMIGSDTTYNVIFLLKNWFSGDQKAKNYSQSIKTPKDIKMLHPSGMFAINLTPCIPYSNLKQLSYNFNYTHGILRYTPKFDLESFDHSLRSYFEIVCDRVCNSSHCLLRQYITQTHFEDTKSGVKHLNKAYKLGLKIDSEFSDYWLDELVKAFKEKKLNVRDVIFEQAFPDYNPKTNSVSPEEESLLIALFYKQLHKYNLQTLFESYIMPNIQIDFWNKNYAVELSTSVFKKWNYEDASFFTDMEGKAQPSPFLITPKKGALKYNNRFGTEYPKGTVCFEDAQLADTKIIFRIPEIHIVDLDSKSRITPGDYTYTNAETFCGLWAGQGQLLIPFGNKNTLVKAYNLAMNNNGVEAHIKLAINPNNAKEVSLNNGSETKYLTLKQATKWLKQSGFDLVDAVPAVDNKHYYFTVFKRIE
jgi:hypothetical protein